jgi:hypothetical protein
MKNTKRIYRIAKDRSYKLRSFLFLWISKNTIPGHFIKKSLLLLLLNIPLLSFAQNCDSVIKKSIDNSTTDTITLASPIRVITKNGTVAFYMDIQNMHNGTIILYMQVIDDNYGCTDDMSKIYIMFSDNTTQTFYNTAIDCKGISMCFIEKDHHKQKDYEETLSQKIIKAIKVEGMERDYETPINKMEAEQFQVSANCLFNNTLKTGIF